MISRESISIQRHAVQCLKERGSEVFCVMEKSTGKPLSYGEFFDRHALLVIIVDEAEKRLG